MVTLGGHGGRVFRVASDSGGTSTGLPMALTVTPEGGAACRYQHDLFAGRAASSLSFIFERERKGAGGIVLPTVQAAKISPVRCKSGCGERCTPR